MKKEIIRKSKYEIDPSARKANSTYSSLSLTEISIFSLLLDHCWMSQTQYSVERDDATIAIEIGVDVDELTMFLDKMTSVDSNPIVEEVFNLDDGSIDISIVELKSQVEEYKYWLEKEQKLTVLRNEVKQTKHSLLDLVKQGDSAFDGVIHYLEPHQRVLSSYVGWLPTKNFETQGQIYKIRKSLVTDLSALYPSLNVEEEILAMYKWFTNSKNKKRSISQLNTFIHNWLERAVVGWSDSKKTSDSFDDEIDKLLGLEENEAVNE